MRVGQEQLSHLNVVVDKRVNDRTFIYL
ncbi:unnamed protein product [Ectocarpus sp. CCAP 1310/34]|nr:unnamed protein product [Ectocarpus sp. CCAP 1310/34]